MPPKSLRNVDASASRASAGRPAASTKTVPPVAEAAAGPSVSTSSTVSQTKTGLTSFGLPPLDDHGLPAVYREGLLLDQMLFKAPIRPVDPDAGPPPATMAAALKEDVANKLRDFGTLTNHLGTSRNQQVAIAFYSTLVAMVAVPLGTMFLVRRTLEAHEVQSVAGFDPVSFGGIVGLMMTLVVSGAYVVWSLRHDAALEDQYMRRDHAVDAPAASKRPQHGDVSGSPTLRGPRTAPPRSSDRKPPQ